jgi:hypothetical protein
LSGNNFDWRVNESEFFNGGNAQKKCDGDFDLSYLIIRKSKKRQALRDVQLKRLLGHVTIKTFSCCNDLVHKKVFNERSKTVKESDDITSDSKLFRIPAAVTEKARSPSVEHWAGTSVKLL